MEKKNYFRNTLIPVLKTGAIIALAVITLISCLSFETTSVLTLTEYTNNPHSISPNYYVLPNGDKVILLQGKTEVITGIDSCVEHEYLDLVGCHKYVEHRVPADKKKTLSFKMPEFIRTKDIVFASSLFPISMKRRIKLIQPEYPYGKSQTYLGGSLITLATQMLNIGYKVEMYDKNFEEVLLKDKDVNTYFGITVLGAPYIPSTIKYTKELFNLYKNPVLVGGQGVESLSPQDFYQLFGESGIQIKNEQDLLNALGENRITLPSALDISIIPMLNKMSESVLKRYMSHEMTMVLSQGCHFKCAFCAAKKTRIEKFKSLPYFSEDMYFLAQKAKSFGLTELNFYATSLDFFQNPKTLAVYLDDLIKIQKETGVCFKIRCLSCMPSFLSASRFFGEAEFQKKLNASGLWCVGFGVDGADPKVWKAQKKNQNKLSEVKDCLDMCQKFDVRAEVLMIMGFPEDTFLSLFKCVASSLRYVTHWKNVVMRPYLAKEYIPGNDYWKLGGKTVENFIKNPKKFYNLDFCAIASKSTHPRFWHRLWSNCSYLIICGLLNPFNKCTTYPLLPQGNTGLYGYLSRRINKMIPFDR